MKRREHIARIHKLIEHLRQAAIVSFNMKEWLSHNGDIVSLSVYDRHFEEALSDILEGSCGAAGCIAGHAVAIFHEDIKALGLDKGPNGDPQSVVFQARGYLGLNVSQAEALFLALDYVTTPQEAACMLYGFVKAQDSLDPEEELPGTYVEAIVSRQHRAAVFPTGT